MPLTSNALLPSNAIYCTLSSQPPSKDYVSSSPSPLHPPQPLSSTLGAPLIILHISRRGIKFQIPLDDLIHRRQKVFLRRHLPPCPNGKHPGLRSNAPQLRPRAVRTQPTDQLPPDIPLDGHALRVDPQDVRSAFQVWKGEFNLSIDTARAHECRVEGRGPVGGEHDFDVAAGVEAVELGDEFQHRSLDFVVPSGAVVESRPSYGVDFIEEDNACFLCPRHLE